MEEDKRTIRKTFNLLAVILIIYNIIFNAAVYFTDGAVFSIMMNLHPEMSFESIYNYVYYSGQALIIGSVIAVFVSYICVRQKPSFKAEKKIDVKTMLKFFIIMKGLQVICSYILLPVEIVIYSMGYNTEAAHKIASAPSIYFSSLVYSVIAAPIAEELFCRGLIMKKMEKYGKLFALIMSALLFGLIHRNIVQFPTTFAMGILFGYLAQEYSLGAAIILHMLNNLFVELAGNIIYAYDIAAAADGIFMYVCAGITIFLFFKNFRTFKEYWHEKKPDKDIVKCFFTSPVMLIVIIYYVYMTIMSISAV